MAAALVRKRFLRLITANTSRSNLLPPTTSPPSAAALSTSFPTHMPPPFEYISLDDFAKMVTVNPFQKSGPPSGAVLESFRDRNFKILSVTMPGVSENGFKVWLDKEKNEVFFKGVGEVEVEFEKERTYEGSLELDGVLNFPIGEITKAEMKNGVLWITLKRNNGGN